jgi:WD40 repeat protein
MLMTGFGHGFGGTCTATPLPWPLRYSYIDTTIGIPAPPESRRPAKKKASVVHDSQLSARCLTRQRQTDTHTHARHAHTREGSHLFPSHFFLLAKAPATTPTMSAMEVESPEPFALSATLAGHEQDVRAVASCNDGAILTGSRDSAVRVWHRHGDDKQFVSTVLHGHTHYVIAVAPGPDINAAASGSNDKHVIEWDLAAGTPARVLEGHTNTVSCVTYSVAIGAVLSASWDSTVKVWKDGACIATLKGHEATVWAVLSLEDDAGRVLTASGDRTCVEQPRVACTRAHKYTLTTHGFRAP